MNKSARDTQMDGKERRVLAARDSRRYHGGCSAGEDTECGYDARDDSVDGAHKLCPPRQVLGRSLVSHRRVAFMAKARARWWTRAVLAVGRGDVRGGWRRGRQRRGMGGSGKGRGLCGCSAPRGPLSRLAARLQHRDACYGSLEFRLRLAKAAHQLLVQLLEHSRIAHDGRVASVASRNATTPVWFESRGRSCKSWRRKRGEEVSEVRYVSRRRGLYSGETSRGERTRDCSRTGVAIKLATKG
jgi:hypothetical protein